ncbi:MAG: hypothetical protein ACRDBH_01480 [Bosea sp. (in: a-proteobacteria)]
MSARVFFGFDEPQDVAPSDRVGTVADLGIEGVLTPAIATQGWTGGGRRFVPSLLHGFVAGDEADGDSALTRDVSIQAILSVDLSADAGPMTVCSRGTDGSAAEYYAFGLELVAAASPGDVDVRWFWQDQAGAIHTAPAATFTSPGDGVPFLLTATRRWAGTSSVVCRYYVGDTRIGEVASTVGAIGGGTTGRLSVGARKTAGSWGRHYSGVIQQLAIYDYELCAEEIEACWQRMTVHQPAGVAHWRALQPDGVPWSSNSDSIIDRMIRVKGQLAGAAASLTYQLGDLLPDRAYLDVITRWEYMRGIEPRPLDSLDIRRARVLASFRREDSYSLPALRELLAPLLDQDAADVQILEFTNRTVEPWESLRPERWHVDASAGTITVVGGKLRLAAGSSDTLPASLIGGQRFHVITSIPEGERGQPANGVGTWAEIKLDTVTSWPSNASAIAGLVWFDWRSRDCLWIGLAKPGANYVLAHRRVVDGAVSSLTTLATFGTSPPASLYVRARRTAAAATMEVEWSTVGFASSLSSASITSIAAPSFVGVGASADGALGSAMDVLFDDFSCDAPLGRRCFSWYVYRDLGLAGTPDLVGAQKVLDQYKPAHVHAHIITSLSLICDHPLSVVDGGPTGGF